MTNEEAKIVIGNIPIKPEVLDDCYSITEYQEAKTMAIKALKQQSCKDCISRQEALSYKHIVYDDDGIGYSVVRADVIAELPSVTPKAKMGRWVAQDIHNCHTDFKCSACGYIHSFMHLYGKPTADYTYCPNCGARMGESEEEI